MRKALLERFTFRHRRAVLAQKIKRYESTDDRAQIEAFQVHRFNATWAYCLAEVPFYRRWSKLHSLPDSITHPIDLLDFPVLDKETILANEAELFQYGQLRSAYTTGGSTGQPSRYPRSRRESVERYANTYLTRSWWQVEPFDTSLLLWGHSHLFGTGSRRLLRRAIRESADWLLNIERLNAYDLSSEALAHDFATLQRRDPVYLVGYSSAIFQLARFIQHNNMALDEGRKLKAVILTAETVTASDVETIRRVLGAPVVLEYGAAETGVIAASGATTWPLKVLWDSIICLVSPVGSLQVTTLGARLFPLINCDIGDWAHNDRDKGSNALELSHVAGRRQEHVTAGALDGSTLTLSAILPVHILKAYPGIVAVQYRQKAERELQIFIQSHSEPCVDDVSRFFFHQIAQDHPNVDETTIRIRWRAQLTRTKAGKHQLFLP